MSEGAGVGDDSGDGAAVATDLGDGPGVREGVAGEHAARSRPAETALHAGKSRTRRVRVINARNAAFMSGVTTACRNSKRG
ncbi:MAG: hypothetical protein ACYDCS_12330 [Candidatus Dormibacteria bacterium]